MMLLQQRGRFHPSTPFCDFPVICVTGRRSVYLRLEFAARICGSNLRLERRRATPGFAAWLFSLAFQPGFPAWFFNSLL
jgi:hypothetical protein